MSLFRERFGEILLQIVDDLRGAGVIGFVEAQRLVTPASPEGIERIGQRLIELGSQTATG
jgi:hypothetical protein